MSDTAWAGIAAICAGLFTAAATVLQAKFSADKAIKIAMLESEVSRLTEKVDELKDCKDQIVNFKAEIVNLKAEVIHQSEYIRVLEDRIRANPKS